MSSDYVKMLEAVVLNYSFREKLRSHETKMILEVIEAHNKVIETKDYKLVYDVLNKGQSHLFLFLDLNDEHFKNTKCNITEEELNKIQTLVKTNFNPKH